MTQFIAFVSGLSTREAILANGNHSTIPEGTYAWVAQQVANEHGIPFVYLPIQTIDNPAPTLTQMGSMVVDQLFIEQMSHQSNGILVTSSVGTGAALTGYKNDKIILAPTAWVTLEGIFDPLTSIPLQLSQHPQLKNKFAAFMDGQTDVFPLPVNNQNGSFPLTRAHLDDPHALRVFAPDAHPRSIESVVAPSETWRKLDYLFNVTGLHNPLCPPFMVEQFNTLARPYVKTIYPTKAYPGTSVTHDEFREALSHAVAIVMRHP